MPGLFDLLMSGGFDNTEPGRNAQMTLAAGLLGGKGTFGSILGNSMMGAQDTYRSSVKDQAAAELSKAHLDELKRASEAARRKQATEDNLAQIQSQYFRPATAGQIGGIDATGGAETDTSAPNNMQPGRPAGMDLRGLMGALYSAPGGFNEALKLEGQLRKDVPTISSTAPGSVSHYFQDGKLITIPGPPIKPHADSPDIQALKLIHGEGTPEFNAALASMMDKKNHIVPQGFNRDAQGALTVDPNWLKVQMQLREAGPNASAANRPAPVAAVELSDAGRKAYSDLALQGKLPPGFGRYGLADRNNFLNEEGAKRYGADGSGVSLAGEQANAGANKAALMAVTKDLAAFRPYKEMLDKNADIAIELAGKVLKTNSALANKPIRWIAQNMTDSPDVAELMAQNHFVTTEAARVLTNPRLVGQLTDSAIKDMQSVVNGNAPLGAYVRVLQRIKSDGTNRTAAMEKERDALATSFTTRNPSSGLSATAKGGLPNMAEIEAELAKRK